MASPWDDKQKPHEKSKFHGRKDGEHGPHEHGMGAEVPPDPKNKKAEDPDADEDVPVAGTGIAAGLPLAGAYPSYDYIPLFTRPPVTNQGMTPRCVAHASAYDQNQHDRPELGQFRTLNQYLFFQRIGGNQYGASITEANQERIERGYPEEPVGNASKHRISKAIQVDKTINAIKAAIALDHGILLLMPFFQSWFHPLASGKLPAPDYFVGYHEIWGYGYNDNIGLWLQNTWGPDYGKDGRVALPYSHIWRARVIHRTVDV